MFPEDFLFAFSGSVCFSKITFELFLEEFISIGCQQTEKARKKFKMESLSESQLRYLHALLNLMLRAERASHLFW
jgi:hypothetical protein